MPDETKVLLFRFKVVKTNSETDNESEPDFEGWGGRSQDSGEPFRLDFRSFETDEEKPEEKRCKR